MKAEILGTLVSIQGGDSGTAPTLMPPTNFVIDPSSTNGNTILNWTAAVPAPANYEIYRSTNGGSTYSLLSTVGGGVTTLTDATVIPAAGQYYYKIRSKNGTLVSSFTDPAGAFESLTLTVNTGTVVYSFPFLQISYGTILVGNETLLTTFSVPKLHTVRGDLVIINLVALLTVTVTSLSSVTGGCGVFDSAQISNIDFPALVSCGNFFGVARNSSLASFSAPLLVSIGGDLQTYTTPNLSSISLPSLTTAVQGLTCYSSQISSASFPALTSVSGGIQFQDCNSLVTIFFPSVIFPDGFIVSFDFDALSSGSVNSILAIGVASATTTSDYELANGTNAAPTGQGIADAATLVTAGNTVNTN